MGRYFIPKFSMSEFSIKQTSLKSKMNNQTNKLITTKLEVYVFIFIHLLSRIKQETLNTTVNTYRVLIFTKEGC